MEFEITYSSPRAVHMYNEKASFSHVQDVFSYKYENKKGRRYWN